MGRITILGQHISLIRPLKVVKHSAQGAWKKVVKKRVRSIILMRRDKVQIAALMGYRMTEV